MSPRAGRDRARAPRGVIRSADDSLAFRACISPWGSRRRRSSRQGPKSSLQLPAAMATCGHALTEATADSSCWIAASFPWSCPSRAAFSVSRSEIRRCNGSSGLQESSSLVWVARAYPEVTLLPTPSARGGHRGHSSRRLRAPCSSGNICMKGRCGRGIVPCRNGESSKRDGLSAGQVFDALTRIYRERRRFPTSKRPLQHTKRGNTLPLLMLSRTARGSTLTIFLRLSGEDPTIP